MSKTVAWAPGMFQGGSRMGLCCPADATVGRGACMVARRFIVLQVLRPGYGGSAQALQTVHWLSPAAVLALGAVLAVGDAGGVVCRAAGPGAGQLLRLHKVRYRDRGRFKCDQCQSYVAWALCSLKRLYLSCWWDVCSDHATDCSSSAAAVWVW